jgi:hypothetical protein
LSEPSPRRPFVRVAETAGFTNPILYIEELRRLPLSRSRVAAPGTALIFRARDGRLRRPNRGYTASEMFVFGPRTGYQIDMSAHGFTAAFEAGPLLVEVAGSWAVTDPAAVVEHRISDLEHACTTELGHRIEDALPAGDAPAGELRERLDALWADGLDVPGGVRLQDLRVDAARTDTLTGERVIQLLVADEEEADPADPAGADPAQLIEELRGLAREGLAAHAAGDATVGRALARLHELATRMADLLPPGGGARPGGDHPGEAGHGDRADDDRHR